MLKKLKPLHIYLLGAILGLLSGVVLRPISSALHSAVVIVALLICGYGIIRQFRGR